MFWAALRSELDTAPPLSPAERVDLFAALGGALGRMHAAERAAVDALAVVRDG